MAATIIKETGSGVTGANSYVTLAEAQAYFDTHPQATAWDALTDDAKTRLLITAARAIDCSIQFNGFKTTASQPMQWPRFGARDPNQYGGAYARTSGSLLSNGEFPSDAIPQGILDAQCEMARFLLAGNRLDDPAGTGIREFELTGTLKVAFDSGNLAQIIPDFVANLLFQFGAPIGGKSACVKLSRV